MNEQSYEDEIDLKEVFFVIWKEKLFILAVTTAVAIGSIVYSLSLNNYFTSESLLIARDSQDSSSLSQYSGMASLVGISLPGSGANNSVFKVMEIIKSREFVKHLLTFENVLPSILAAKSFNSSSEELYFDSDIYDVETKTWVREPEGNKGVIPSYLEAHLAYLEMLSISQNEITGLISISIEHISPIFAQELLTLIIKEANKLNRDIDIDSSSKAISFFEKELSKTSLVEIKRSINQLLEAQLEMRMMASIHEEYSLMTIEPPFIPEKKSRPSRSFIVIFATMLGGLISVLWVLVRHYLYNEKTNN